MQFEVAMMCGACKDKIAAELKSKGYDKFDIDLNTNLLTFKEDVNPNAVIRTVNNIGYHITEVKHDSIWDD